MLSIWTIGGRQTFCNLLPRFPGIFLFPVFGPFMFGPQKCNCCKTSSNNKMQLSFLHTYINIIIWSGGAATAVYHSPVISTFHSGYVLNLIFIINLLVMAPLTILTFVYQISEKACCFCKCCSSCCCPFTQRSVHSTDEGQQKIKIQRSSNSQEQGFEMDEVV